MATGDFGALLRRHRRAAGLSQEALAERAMLSAQAIRALERGARRYPRETTIRRLADALRLTGADRAALLDAVPPAGAARPAPLPDLALPGPIPRQLPPATIDFTGRHQEVAALVEVLSPPRGSVPVIAGLPGTGKTALAVQVGHLVAAQFPDGQLFLSAADPPLHNALSALGLSAADQPTDPGEAAGRYRSALAGRRMLVLVDDVTSARQVLELLPGTPGSAALITSRRTLAGLPGAHHLRLDGLADADALDLLIRIGGTRATADPAAAREVVRYCDNLPLAIRIAGAKLESQTIAELAAALRDEDRRLDELSFDDHGVRAGLDASLDALGNDPAGLNLYARLGSIDEPTVTTAETAVWERLADLHLLQAAAPGRYRITDLVRLHARESASRAAD